MKLPLALVATCLALVLTACENPGSPTPGGNNNPNNPGNPSNPGETNTSTYHFLADYTVWDKDLTAALATTAKGSIFPYKDNQGTWAQALSLAGTEVSTTINTNNNLPLKNAGDSVSLSVTLDGLVFTGSATVPDALVGVTLKQGATTISPTPGGEITFDPGQALVVSWNTNPLVHPAQWVTVVQPNNSTMTLRVAFYQGTLTLPVAWATSGSTFTVYATNEATNLAPTTHLDTAHASFRVNHAVNDASDRFVVH